MFQENTFEERLISWANFRNCLETAQEPLSLLCHRYNELNRYSCIYNPWNQAEWPDPWELISNNRYCCFTIVLGMCYTLSYTNRFRTCDMKILITKDNQDKTTKYLAQIAPNIIGYNEDLSSIHIKQMPSSAVIQKTFTLQIKR